MKNHTRVLIVLMLSTFFFALGAGGARAQESARDELRETRQEKRETREEVREQRTDNRCDVLNTRIDNRIESFYNLKDERVERYTAFAEKLQSINEKLKEEGFDTSELESNWQTMNEKIQNYAEEYTEFIEALENAKQYTCGESQGEFKNALDEARVELLDVRAAGTDIRSYYVSTIKPNVQELRDQITSDSTTE